MGENSKIEWTHHTFNPWRGCTKVSAGCDNCYAEKMSRRNPDVLGVWGKHGTRVVASDAMWREPLKWNRAAEQAGERHRVFCASLADVFEAPETMPAESWNAVLDARRRLFVLIRKTPHLDWLLLTKRPENVTTMALDFFGDSDWPANVWIGTSVEDQKTADERIPELLNIPAKVRFLSIEPLLGPVDLSRWLVPWNRAVDHSGAFPNHILGPRDDGMYPMDCDCGWSNENDDHIDWVIVGGESGPNARPMHPDWVRSIRDQCVAAGVPFFFKQWGEWVGGKRPDSNPANLTKLHNGKITDIALKRVRHWFDGVDFSERVGKATAGRLLDGREWNELPEAMR